MKLGPLRHFSRHAGLFWPFLVRYRRYYLAGLASLIAVDLINIARPLILGRATDLLVTGGSRTDLALLAGLYLALAVLLGLGRYVWRLCFMGPSLRVGRDLRLELGADEVSLHFIDTGVPHAVVFVQDLEGVDVTGMGRKIRYHRSFRPAGTNVDFVKVEGEGHLRIRTYERGVEDETLACGTGAVAAALVAHLRGLGSSPTTVVPRGDEPMQVYYRYEEGRFIEVALEGDVRLIYKGRIEEEALW